MKHRKNDHVDLSFSLEERVKNLLVPPRPYIRYIAYKEKMRGERELSLLPYLVERRKISINIGANKGAYTYFLSKLFREVLAFEPNPRIFPILGRAVAANVTAYPVALSDRSGVATFRTPKRKKGLSNQRGTLSEILTEEPYSEIKVETRRLDDYGLSMRWSHLVGQFGGAVKGVFRLLIMPPKSCLSRPAVVEPVEMRARREPCPSYPQAARPHRPRPAFGHRGRSATVQCCRSRSIR